jgi:hypothetical protein
MADPKPPATPPSPTEPSPTEPPATEPSATELPTTEPSPTESPATEPSPTEPSPTEPPATEPPATPQPKTDPPLSGTSTLATAGPPADPTARMTPAEIEFYIRAAMNQDRTPGNVLVVCHPHRMYKVPRGLFTALRRAGCTVEIVETQRDRVESVEAIRSALVRLSSEGRPLDLMVISGDGSMDHHVLVACFKAFYPDLVSHRPSEIRVHDLTQSDLSAIPATYRKAFLSPLPTGQGIPTDDDTIKALWVLRSELDRPLRRGHSVRRIVRRTDRSASDPILRLAVLATLLPHRVTLRTDGFDLSGLAEAKREELFRGLYTSLRSIVLYPAGTAADNAVFAGTPGWGYAQLAPILTRFQWLDGLRSRLEAGVVRRFMRFFLETGVVVPERISFVGFDGDWQSISSHAAGGPGGGHFFSADLTSKTKGMLGYLMRIPRVLVVEGIFGSTIVQVRSLTEGGKTKSYTEAQMTEGLYTNRAFVAGVGSVPTTGPTSFAGQSSLVLIPSIWYRSPSGQRQINLRGLGAFTEGIVKGVMARALHMVGLGVGKLAGGGKFSLLLPEHQVAIKEGEQIRMRYLTANKTPRAVPVQVSGDPFQASEMSIVSSWAPLPVLGHNDSLLLSGTRAALADVRLQQSYDLEEVYIGGVRYFRHHVGERWSDEMNTRTGLFQPPRFMRFSLTEAQRRLIRTWRDQGAGEFVDTTKAGIDLGRRGRYANNNDQTAHLVLLREPHAFLLLRQIRSGEGKIFESRTRYRSRGPSWIIHNSQTIEWRQDAPPLLVQEDHYFRNAEEFQRDALSFFPVGKLKEGEGPPQK